MKKLLYTVLGVIAGSILTLPFTASALSTFITVQGGTGTTTPSGILYGDNGATSHLNTATIGSGLTFTGGTLSATGGSATFPFTPNTNFGVNVSATSTPIWDTVGIFASSTSQFSNASTTLLTVKGREFADIILGNTTALDVGDPSYTNYLEFTSSGITSFGNALAFASGAHTLTFGPTIDANGMKFQTNDSHYLFLGNSNYAILDASNVASSNKTFTFPNTTGTFCLTITCVTSVTATYPILSTGGNTPVISTAFGTTTTWGIGNNGFFIAGPTGIPFVAASSTLNLPFSALPNVNANSVLGNKTGAAATATSVATSSLFTFSPAFSAGSTLLQNVTYQSFGYFATTTSGWTGTTTGQAEIGYGETWNQIQCSVSPSGGFLGVDIYWGSSHMNFVYASSTIGTTTLSSNNTVPPGQLVKIDVGTTTSNSITGITCTVKKTL